MYLEKLNKSLAKSLTSAGFDTPTPLQEKAISKIKSGSDILFIAPDNSGKSTTIAIGVIQQLKCAMEDIPRAVIAVPTKENALALKEIFDKLAYNTDLRILCAYSEKDLEEQRDEIYAGADIVIGTAKRLGELYSGTGLNFRILKMFIVDDMELVNKTEHFSQIERLSMITSKYQVLFFTSKMTEKIEKLSNKAMKNMSIIEIN